MAEITARNIADANALSVAAKAIDGLRAKLAESEAARLKAEGQVRRDVEVRPSRRLSCGCEYSFTKSKTKVRYCEKHYMQLLLESRVRRG